MSHPKGAVPRIRLARVEQVRPGSETGMDREDGAQRIDARSAPAGEGQILLANLPGSAPGERLRVAIGQAWDGRLTIDLREQHFDDALGWSDQRTLSMDPSQFKQLQAVLGLKAADRDEWRDEAPATIPFPGLKPSPSARRRRPCVERA